MRNLKGPYMQKWQYPIHNVTLETSVSDPYHFDADPDPRIRIRDDWSGSEVTFDSVNRIFPIKCYARL